MNKFNSDFEFWQRTLKLFHPSLFLSESKNIMKEKQEVVDTPFWIFELENACDKTLIAISNEYDTSAAHTIKNPQRVRDNSYWWTRNKN